MVCAADAIISWRKEEKKKKKKTIADRFIQLEMTIFSDVASAEHALTIKTRTDTLWCHSGIQKLTLAVDIISRHKGIGKSCNATQPDHEGDIRVKHTSQQVTSWKSDSLFSYHRHTE